jgi:hypothetical protein
MIGSGDIGRGGLCVIVGEQGVALRFIASDGDEVFFDMLALVGDLDSEEGRILLQWCRDRVQDAMAYDLPADIREKVEDRIAQVASLIDAEAAREPQR